jgi:photosystem II stability/assembly factor-like uncharacterized protein
MLKMTRRLTLIAFLLFAFTCSFAQWVPLGPDGGDARSITYDPQNADYILLGTSSGQLYRSTDGGRSWSRFARIGTDDYVLDHIVISPSNSKLIYVSAWSVEHQTDAGDLFRSTDGGKTWTALAFPHNKSIRAMAVAPSDQKVVVIGALDGLFRSDDGGNNWHRMSPANHAEIKNIESIAIDPKDPNTVYAGTWHLAWKTTDGGQNWHPIHNGVTDDSDIFSIVIDKLAPNNVYLSACSGIYHSDNYAELFHKAQGIPFSARRTRVLKMDPNNEHVVYAGTTEGLWRTTDDSRTWKRVSADNLIVNDVMIDPRNSNRVLLATDRSGVLVSDNAAATFTPSNHGFSHRQVSAAIADRNNPDLLYAGVINDKEFGGVLVSHDGGEQWTHINSGLAGRDVFTLKQTNSGALLAGTNRGVFELAKGSSVWHPVNTVIREKTTYVKKTVLTKSHGKTKRVTTSEKKTVATKGELTSHVAQIEGAGSRLFAATSSGLFESKDDGRNWRQVEDAGTQDYTSVAALGDTVIASSLRGAIVSTDGGATWTTAKVPTFITAIFSVAVTPESVWMATREGAWRSSDHGVYWDHILSGIPARNVNYVSYDPASHRLHATSTSGEFFFTSNNGQSWTRDAKDWTVRAAVPAGGRVFALTAYEGIIAPASKTQSRLENSGGGSR